MHRSAARLPRVRKRPLAAVTIGAALLAATVAVGGTSATARAAGTRPAVLAVPAPPVPCDSQLFLTGYGVGSLVGLSSRDSSTALPFPIDIGDAVAEWFVVPHWGGIAVRTDLGLAYFWGPTQTAPVLLPEDQVATAMYAATDNAGTYVTTQSGQIWLLGGATNSVSQFVLPPGEELDHVVDGVAAVSKTGKVYFFADGGEVFTLPGGEIVQSAYRFPKSFRSFVITTTGHVYGRGDGSDGELGSGSLPGPGDLPARYLLPDGAVADEVFDAVDGTFVRTTDGNLYGSGSNTWGQLGSGATSNTLTPIQVPLPTGEIPLTVRSVQDTVYGYETVTVIRTASGRLLRAGSHTKRASIVEFILDDSVTAVEFGVISGPLIPYLWALGSNGGLYFTSLLVDHVGSTNGMDRLDSSLSFTGAVEGYSGQLFLNTVADLYELTGNEDDFLEDYTLTRRIRSTSSTGTLQQLAVSASDSLIAVLTESGDVLGRGDSRWGQLGIKTPKPVTSSRKFPLPKGYYALRTEVAGGNQLVAEACPLPLANVSAPSGSDGDRSVSLSWEVPFVQRGRVSNYLVEYSRDSGEWTRVRKAVNGSRTLRVKGLRNGASYRFRIAAVNPSGTGPWVETEAFVPHTTPGSPQGFTVTPANGSLLLSWTPPKSDGGSPILDYRVQYSAPGGGWITVDDGVSTNTSATVSGLVNGRKYRVRVQAINDAGRGASTIIRTRRPSAG